LIRRYEELSQSQAAYPFGSESLTGFNLLCGEAYVGTGETITEHTIEGGFYRIAISGTGHIAIASKEGSVIMAHLGNETLKIYPPCETRLPGPAIEPLLTITTEGNKAQGSFRNLTAGEAHFAFVVYYFNEQSELEFGKYVELWSIRTDTRSVEDSAWQPIERHLQNLDLFEDSSWVSVTSKSEDLHVFLANIDEDCVEMEDNKSGGWFTVGRDGEEIWLFPFDRALMTIPELPMGPVSGFVVRQIAAGSNHIAIIALEDDDKYQLWTFGLNDHGQCGYSNECQEAGGGTNEGGWHLVYETPPGRRLGQVVCGKWNTFFVEIDLPDQGSNRQDLTI